MCIRDSRADGIAAVGAGQTGDADSDIGPGSFGCAQCLSLIHI